MNYFAPLFLSVFIHFGLVLSFSNFFTIDFDKFNIAAKKPVTAYIVFAENKKTQKNPIKIKQDLQNKTILEIEAEKIEITSSTSVIEAIEALENRKTSDTQEKVEVSQSDVEKYSFVIKKQVMANWKRPKNLNSNLKTEIQINLVPTGEIISTRIIKGSGNKIYDDSALSAVSKVRSFEGLNMQMSLFDQHFREFILIFSPN